MSRVICIIDKLCSSSTRNPKIGDFFGGDLDQREITGQAAMNMESSILRAQSGVVEVFEVLGGSAKKNS